MGSVWCVRGSTAGAASAGSGMQASRLVAAAKEP